MTSDELRDILTRRLEKPYEKQNDYYAWKKPDGTWFMLGMECYRDKHILKYEFYPHFKDYGAAFYSIDPHVTHRRGPHTFDPLQELISQVEKYEYLGSWRDPEIFMDGHNGKVASCGRWELAKEHISKQLSIAQPSLDGEIAKAESRRVARESSAGSALRENTSLLL